MKTRETYRTPSSPSSPSSTLTQRTDHERTDLRGENLPEHPAHLRRGVLAPHQRRQRRKRLPNLLREQVVREPRQRLQRVHRERRPRVNLVPRLGADAIAALATDGKLIKRPFVEVNSSTYLTGFKPDLWESALQG